MNLGAERRKREMRDGETESSEIRAETTTDNREQKRRDTIQNRFRAGAGGRRCKQAAAAGGRRSEEEGDPVPVHGVCHDSDHDNTDKPHTARTTTHFTYIYI